MSYRKSNFSSAKFAFFEYLLLLSAPEIKTSDKNRQVNSPRPLTLKSVFIVGTLLP